MDYLSGFIRQNIVMDKYSTEILSKSYSEDLQDKEPSQNDMGHYNVTEMISNEDEAYSDEVLRYKKINVSKAGHLSAQLMNLPFDKFKESKKYTYDEYDIFKKIRDAYDACACKICKCLAGTVISPQLQFCDCEPCKCKDCILTSNLRKNSFNVRPSTEKKYDKIRNMISNERKYTKCDCKPCDCIECTQHSTRNSMDFKPNYRTQIGTTANKLLTKAPTRQANAPVCYPTNETSIGFSKFSNCSRATWINDACQPDTSTTCVWASRSEALIEKQSTITLKHNTSTVTNNAPVTVYQSQSNKKCTCSVCECIVCECKGNDWTCRSINPRKLNDADFCKCATCSCQFCSHNNQTTLRSIERFKCKCDICSCLQCDKNSEWKSGLNKIEIDIPTPYRKKCKCAPCECSVCELGKYDRTLCDYDKNWFEHCGAGVECKTTGDQIYPITRINNKPSISRMMRENPLTYECNEYAQIIKSRIQSNTMSREKTKHGNVYYVTSRKAYNTSNTIPSSEQLKTKQNISKNPIHNNTNMDNNKINFGDTVKITTTHQNIQISKKSSKEVAVIAFTASKDEQVDNMNKSNFKSFYSKSGCRSTQTILKSPSSSCENKGYCMNTISLPVTNIDDNLRTSSCNSFIYDIREKKYETNPNIYHCSNITNTFDENNTAALVRIHQNNDDVERKFCEHFSCDSLGECKSNSRNTEEIVKTDYESVSATLRKAKQFTFHLRKILHNYEKANTEFESISEKLTNSRHVTVKESRNSFNGQIYEDVKKSQSVCNNREVDIIPNEVCLKVNRSCNPITKHADDEKKGNPVKHSLKNENLTERFKQVSADNILVSNYSDSTFVELAATNTNILTALQNHGSIKENETKIIRDKDNSQHNVDLLCDDTPPVLMKCINKQQKPSNDNEVELLRTQKIQNILKQNLVSDPFIERVSSRSTPMMELKDNFIFNYHTKTLVRSTAPSVVLQLHIVNAKVEKHLTRTTNLGMNKS